MMKRGVTCFGISTNKLPERAVSVRLVSDVFLKCRLQLHLPSSLSRLRLVPIPASEPDWRRRSPGVGGSFACQRLLKRAERQAG